MDPTTRPYARRILLLHLVLLIIVAGLVSLASDEVYNRTRDQIVGQARSRQELLAKQTASAIDSYYASITADLNFLRRSEESPEHAERHSILNQVASNLPAPPRLLRPLWNQLDGRASHLIYVNRKTLQVVHAYPEESSREDIRGVLLPFASFLRDLDHPGVSPFRPTREGGINLIAVPLNGEYVLAAVVPVSNVEQQFVRVVNRDPARVSSATLLDETGAVMVTSDLTNPAFISSTLPSEHPSSRPVRRMLLRLNMTQLTPGTTEYREPTPLPVPAGHTSSHKTTLPPRITTVEPVSVEDRTFYIVINTPLAKITSAVTTMFTRALIGAIVVILSVTAILVSTAIRLIRSRQRLENLRHEMLTRELDQARSIQIHWLPTKESCPTSLELAAVNQTANHISGDFYDWFTLPDGRAVVTIGDVTGHGMSAAFLMATTQLLVRTTLPRTFDPAACLVEVNHQLCSQSFHGQFVTMLILVIDPHASNITIATAGHMPPLLRSASRYRPLTLEPQLPLGIDSDTTYQSEIFPISAGQSLVLYTDGIPEAAAPDGSRFGLPRLLEALDSSPGSSPQHLIDVIGAAVAAFHTTRPLSDDLTLVALTFTPAKTTTTPIPPRPAQAAT